MINELAHTTGSGSVPDSSSGIQQNTALGKEKFLRLLVTQLQNQDPMSPMDGQEFAAQLAQFTSVEQLLNIQQTLVENGRLNGMLAQGINSGVASGLIGHEVEAVSSMLYWDGGGSSTAHIDLGRAASSVEVVLRDSEGNVVRTLDMGALEAGRHEIEWDGRDLNGAAVPKGTYHIEVVTRDAAGDPVQTRTLVGGRVDRVTFGQDGIKLWIDELALSMSDIRSVKQ